MLNKLQKFFEQYLNTETETSASLEHRLQLASAVLMVEMSHADDQITVQEEQTIQQILNQRFQLGSSELDALLELAHDKKHEATDYYEFTSLLNEHYTQEQRIKLVEELWSIAFSDGQLDKFEEHLLRRLAELLHIPHQDFIRTKHKALKN